MYSSVINESVEGTFASHTQYAFGKWCYSDRAKKFEITDTFKEIDAPHKEFHDVFLPVVELIRSGGDILKHKEFVLEKLNRAENVSKYLFKLLDKIVKEEMASKNKRREV
ncbi:MAG: CZB domain-containing protein [Hydrogenothermaceae bacterium]|nr:CZB domain-containing protein [Hydrogenothermaceae bacterium]